MHPSHPMLVVYDYIQCRLVFLITLVKESIQENLFYKDSVSDALIKEIKRYNIYIQNTLLKDILYKF
jgi:hypothetical protein